MSQLLKISIFVRSKRLEVRPTVQKIFEIINKYFEKS